MTRNDGGSAFPCPPDYDASDSGTFRQVAPGSAGMTLREWMACKLAAAWVVALSRRSHQTGYTDVSAAHEANMLAIGQTDDLLDMLAELAKPVTANYETMEWWRDVARSLSAEVDQQAGRIAELERKQFGM